MAFGKWLELKGIEAKGSKTGAVLCIDVCGLGVTVAHGLLTLCRRGLKCLHGRTASRRAAVSVEGIGFWHPCDTVVYMLAPYTPYSIWQVAGAERH
jgi:hypothetical protein